MKKIRIKLNIIIVMILASFTVSSCLLDDEKTDFGKGPVLVLFEKSEVVANFIKDESNAIYEYQVPIVIIGGKNEPLSEDVQITIALDPSSTATEGVEFDFTEKNITLPAGEMSVMALIKVNSKNLDPFNPKDVVLKITATSETIAEDPTTSITLQAACKLDMNSFVGTYTAVNTRFTAPVIATVTLGPEPNSLRILNADGVGSDIIILLSADVTNPTITYLSEKYDAYLANHATYGHIWATTIAPEKSTYTSCNNFMSLEFKRCVGIGCFGGSRIISLTKN